MDAKDFLKNATGFAKEFFETQALNLIGVDIGLNSIKVAEIIVDKDEYQLDRFASVQLPEGALIEDEIQKPEEIQEAIREALKQAGIKNNNISLGISGPNTVVKKLTVAAGSDQEIEDQVLWESDQYIPFGIENSKVVHHVYGENPGGGIEVLMAAAQMDMLDAHSDLLKDISLKAKIIDMKIFALANVFEHLYADRIESVNETNLIIDFGAQYTTIVILKGEQIIFSREISIGGILITEEIQREMGLNYFEAEDLKTVGDEEGNLPEEVLGIVNGQMESFCGEIQKSINFFLTSSGEENITSCYITGGNSLLPDLSKILGELLEVKVEFIDPFSRFQFSSKNLSEEALDYISSQGCVAIGLAMRKLNK